MAENSKIQWTDHTFNPWRGCTKVSAECTHCYAETLSKRNPKTLGVWGDNGTRVVASEAMWREPVKWNNREAAKAGVRRRVFCASLADVFEDWPNQLKMSNGSWANRNYHMGAFTGYQGCSLSGGNNALAIDDVRARLFRLIDSTPNLDWLLLTKRPENIARMMPPFFPGGYMAEAVLMNQEGARPNVWLGTSVGTQATADERIPHLLRAPAAVRFLSCEPLLEEVNLGRLVFHHPGRSQLDKWHDREMLGRRDIDWVIIGGESGKGARPCNLAWIRSLIEQCKAAGTKCFVKQLGRSYFSGDSNHSHIFPRDSHGGDMAEWIEDLRVREMPEVRS